MSLRTKQTLSVASGAAPTFTAAAASDTMAPGRNVFAVYRSTHSVQCDVTVVIPGNLDTGVAYPDKVYSLEVGNVTMQELWIPLEKFMQDPTTSLVTITTEIQNATITMAVVER